MLNINTLFCGYVEYCWLAVTVIFFFPPPVLFTDTQRLVKLCRPMHVQWLKCERAGHKSLWKGSMDMWTEHFPCLAEEKVDLVENFGSSPSPWWTRICEGGQGFGKEGFFFFHTLKSSESFLCNPHSLPPTCGLWHFVCRPCHFEHWCHQFAPDWTFSPNKNIVGRLAFLFTLYLQSQRFCREGSDRSNCSVTENFHLCLS